MARAVVVVFSSTFGATETVFWVKAGWARFAAMTREEDEVGGEGKTRIDWGVDLVQEGRMLRDDEPAACEIRNTLRYPQKEEGGEK